MIRVLHIIDHLGSGGAQTALLNLLKYRDQAVFSHVVATMHGKGSVADEFEALGVRVEPLSAAKWPPGYLVSLPRLLRTESFDIVHTHLFGANWLARPLASLLGQRVIFTHDQCNDAMREKPACLFVDRLTNAAAMKILAVSQSTVRFLEQKEHLPSERIEYFPNGVDLEAFPPVSAERRKLARKKWGLPERGLIVGGVGRLVPQKDFNTFLEAAARLPEQPDGIHFAIFGDGPEEKELKAKTAVLGLSEKVSFLGYVSDRAAIYAAIDVLFLTSRYEGTPMVLLEAMASGVSIAASAVDGTAEILVDGMTAGLFPPASADAASQALRSLLENESLRVSLAAAARQVAFAHYDVRLHMRRLEELYEIAVNQKKSA